LTWLHCISSAHIDTQPYHVPAPAPLRATWSRSHPLTQHLFVFVLVSTLVGREEEPGAPGRPFVGPGPGRFDHGGLITITGSVAERLRAVAVWRRVGAWICVTVAGWRVGPGGTCRLAACRACPSLERFSGRDSDSENACTLRVGECRLPLASRCRRIGPVPVTPSAVPACPSPCAAQRVRSCPCPRPAAAPLSMPLCPAACRVSLALHWTGPDRKRL
jgi:hypothetical protein